MLPAGAVPPSPRSAVRTVGIVVTECSVATPDAAARLGIEVEVEKVSDPRSIAMAGVMSTPGISVDGRLVHAGGLPDADKLDSWLSG